MCAARAGQGGAVRYLLSLGGTARGAREEEEAAAALAEDAGYHELARLLREREPPRAVAEEPPHPCSPHFCPTCGTYFEDPPAQHRSSTAHLLARGAADTLQPPPPTFHIPPTNVGFRLLLRGGWDGRGGLGPTGEGPRTPVPTRLKRDRGGLGCPGGGRPRVTHFGAGDAAAVAGPPRGSGGGAAQGGRGTGPPLRGGRSGLGATPAGLYGVVRTPPNPARPPRPPPGPPQPARRPPPVEDLGAKRGDSSPTAVTPAGPPAAAARSRRWGGGGHLWGGGGAHPNPEGRWLERLLQEWEDECGEPPWYLESRCLPHGRPTLCPTAVAESPPITPRSCPMAGPPPAA
ncbi:LOW QUALITY PROTEIN: G patch domain and ankyrin repeat-containing protein 1 [Haliaeetus albicilla]|uniref:LOW QUALITY PROTEIN: G patch domain and ankyrin repeat-containing protein 1 n=1 Tax=Haliaeetus albicilla TaxID=8969 RepID=UPI0037E7F789